MSIIYNNQVVAGKYTQQVVADADTVNAGIIKLATEEQVIEGVDNTTAITPFYLAQKQDKISAGDGIVIDNNEISCTVNPDEQTIVRKDNGTMQCIGQLTKSNTLKFDWEGTQAEYNVAYLNGTIQPDWYCYITDDEEFVDYGDIANQSLSNLKAEGEARFEAKADIDLNNLSETGQAKFDIKADKATTLEGYGITDGLNKNQITNCLLEVPQNIKLELNDGVLTLKAGSKVIVPNGVGVFDEVEITQDISYPSISHATTTNRMVMFNISNNSLSGYSSEWVVSGATAPSLSGTGYAWYDTANNVINQTTDSGTTWKPVLSLPICIGNYIKDSGFTSIDQIFNGMGYIGSTIWVDKGVKGLIPNGRNADGTLKNYEIITSRVFTRSYNSDSVTHFMYLGANGIGNQRYNIYDESTNINWNGDGTQFHHALVGTFEANDGINNFVTKQPFRAIDYSDKPEVSAWAMPSSKYVDLTLGASNTTYTAPANGYYYLAKKTTATAQYIALENMQSNMTIAFNCSASGQTMKAFMPVTKNQAVKVSYNAGDNTEYFRFIYAQGEL